MVGTYEVWLVALSVAVAIFASYVALDLASRVSAAAGSTARTYWLIGGALSMGCGIWSMHFIGMLAFRLPIPMAYDIPVTLLSLLFAVAASAFALHVVSRHSLGTGRLLASGTVMGAGIATMHYTGMAAMEIAPGIDYDPPLLVLSVCIAVMASVAALWIAFQLRTETMLSAFWKKAGSALVMGIAISGMHYTGMAAAHFAPGSICTADPGTISNDWLAASIGSFTFLFLATTLLVSVFDARLADRSARLAAALRRTNAELESHAGELARTQRALIASEQRYRALWETSNEAIVLLSEDNRIAYANPAVRDVFGHAPEDVEGRDIEMLQPPRLRAAHREGMARYLDTGQPMLDWRSTETSGLHADGHEFPIEIAFSRLEFDGRTGFAGFIRDITDRKHAENLLAGQKQVLEAVSSDAGLSQTLQTLNRMVEEHVPGTLCSIQLADEDGKNLHCGAADSLPAEYNTALGVIAIGPGQGSCGTAAHRRELVVVEDIASDPLWEPARELALRHGLRACWSHPVISADGRLLGTFAVYRRQTGGPQQSDLDTIRSAAALAGIAIERKRAQEHVQQTTERFLLVARATNDAVWDWNFAANTVWWNEGFQQMFGYHPHEIEPGPESWSSRIHPGDMERVLAGIHTVIDNAHAENWSAEYRFRRSDGSYADVYDRGYVIRDDTGRALRMLGAMMDISGRKQAEQRVRRLNRVYAVLSGINALIVRSRDRAELLGEACRIAIEQGGFGMAFIGLLSPDTSEATPVAWAGPDAEQFVGSIATTPDIPLAQAGAVGDALREGKPVFVNDIGAELERGKGGARRRAVYEMGYRSLIALPLIVEGRVEGHLSLYVREKNFFTEEEVKLLTELANDISFALEHISKREKLDYLAYYDTLTGLPNRTLFHERLGHQLHVASQQGVRVALLVGDIKRFRLINESMGRHAGDALLKAITARLKSTWPDPDNLARIASDFFAGIVFNFGDLNEIRALLGRLTTEVTAPAFSIEGKELSIAMTAGIAVFPGDGADAEHLFNNAEAALKQAKARGERYLFYQPAMNATVTETLLLENKMRRAIEKHQFVLHYQPKFNLASGRVSGLEALIRWNDPDSGLVPPGRFIPLLEETGMINEIGLWVMRQALSDHARWQQQGLHPPRIAINVSAIQLAREDFVGTVREVISRTSADTHGLDLEITESLLMQDIEGNIAKLSALRDMGVRIAIDDFGTGYSSLGYLARLPVNALKIDRSFIVTMAQQPDNMSIVSTIISLAHSLGLRVIAEGVEAEEQRKFLQLLRCDEIQGYLVSKPLPPEEVEPLLREEARHAQSGRHAGS